MIQVLAVSGGEDLSNDQMAVLGAAVGQALLDDIGCIFVVAHAQHTPFKFLHYHGSLSRPSVLHNVLQRTIGEVIMYVPS